MGISSPLSLGGLGTTTSQDAGNLAAKSTHGQRVHILGATCWPDTFVWDGKLLPLHCPFFGASSGHRWNDSIHPSFFVNRFYGSVTIFHPKFLQVRWSYQPHLTPAPWKQPLWVHWKTSAVWLISFSTFPVEMPWSNRTLHRMVVEVLRNPWMATKPVVMIKFSPDLGQGLAIPSGTGFCPSSHVSFNYAIQEVGLFFLGGLCDPCDFFGERWTGRLGWCIFLLKEERFRTQKSSKSQGSCWKMLPTKSLQEDKRLREFAKLAFQLFVRGFLDLAKTRGALDTVTFFCMSKMEGRK